MISGFEDGYKFYCDNAGIAYAALEGEDFFFNRAEYVANVESRIEDLENSINSFLGDNTPARQLKGDIAEYWHAKVFNVNAAINQSDHEAYVDRSNEYGSVDISTNFEDSFGLKYYANGEESAKQQAISVFQKYKVYQSKGGKDPLEKYLSDRNYSDQDVLNDPVYLGQIRVIPKDQLETATDWLERMIKTESQRRPEQVKRYQDTLDLLRDRLSDNEGNESIPLTKDEAEKLAILAKEGKFKAEDFGITAPELINAEMIIKESLKAGLSAAVISLILKTGPEIYKSIEYLIKNGEIDEDQFKKVGFAAISGSSEGFIRGTMAAGITLCCRSGLLGEGLKNIDAGIIGALVVVSINTMKNAYWVSRGQKTRAELTEELIKNLIIAYASIGFGFLGRMAMPQLPTIGYLLGSFVGSLVGSFVYDIGYKATLSFCIDSGVTMFGLVDQDYKLPDDVVEQIGIDTFEYETLNIDSFKPETIGFDTFTPESIEEESFEITFLRRGVIGINKIGYIA